MGWHRVCALAPVRQIIQGCVGFPDGKSLHGARKVFPTYGSDHDRRQCRSWVARFLLIVRCPGSVVVVECLPLRWDRPIHVQFFRGKKGETAPTKWPANDGLSLVFC